MGSYSVRLGSTLTFDEEQEKDLIMIMEYLNSTHSTGKFISNLVRIALDNPEILDIKNGKFEKGAIVKQLESLGVSPNRHAFFTNLSREVDEMRKKVDLIYNMSLQTYTLAQMGKHLGLEEKSDNTLMASFVLEKQIKEIQDKLGITLGSTPFESSKLDSAHSRADGTLEYIINTYSGVVNELKNMLDIKPIEVPVQSVSVPQTVVEIPVQTVKEEVATVVDSSDDETVDFGTGFEMNEELSNFFTE